MLNKKTSKIVLGLIIFNLMASTALAAAEPQWPNPTTPTPQQISSTTGTNDSSIMPTAARTSGGNTIIVWEDLRNGGNHDIYAQKIDSSGSKLWSTSDVAIANSADYEAGSLYVIADDNDGVFVAYRVCPTSNCAFDNDIHVAHIDSSGTVLWDNTIDNTSVFADVQLMGDFNGGFYIAWQNMNAGTYEIFLSHINSTGSVNANWNLAGSGTYRAVMLDKPSAYPTSWNYFNSMFYGDDGKIIIVFGNTGDRKAYASKINSNGGYVDWTSPVEITDDHMLPDLSAISGVSDDNGGAFIAYMADGDPGTKYIKEQHINMSGNLDWNGGNSVIIKSYSTATSSPSGINLFADGSGGSILLQSDYNELSEENSVYAQKIDNSGNLQWGPFGISLSMLEDGISSYLVMNGNYLRYLTEFVDASGAIIFPTIEEDLAGPTYKINVYKITSGGTNDWGNNGYELASMSEWPSLVSTISDSSTGAIFVWPDMNSPNINVIGQRIGTSAPVGGCVSGGNVVCGSQDLQCPALVNSFGTGTTAPANFQIGDDGSRSVSSSNDTSFSAALNGSYFDNDNDATYNDASDEFTFSSNTPLTCGGPTRSVQLTVSASPFVNGLTQNLISYGADGAASGTGNNADYYAMFSVITSADTTCSAGCVLAEGAVESNNGIKHGEQNFFASGTLGDASHAAGFDIDSILVNEQNIPNTVTLYNNPDGFEGNISIPGLQYNLAMPANPVYSGSFTSTVTYTLNS